MFLFFLRNKALQHTQSLMPTDRRGVVCLHGHLWSWQLWREEHRAAYKAQHWKTSQTHTTEAQAWLYSRTRTGFIVAFIWLDFTFQSRTGIFSRDNVNFFTYHKHTKKEHVYWHERLVLTSHTHFLMIKRLLVHKKTWRMRPPIISHASYFIAC